MAIKLEGSVVPAQSERGIMLAQPKAAEPEAFQEVLTQEEAARFLRISVPTLKTLVDERKIPALKIGERIIFGREALRKWVNGF